MEIKNILLSTSNLIYLTNNLRISLSRCSANSSSIAIIEPLFVKKLTY